MLPRRLLQTTLSTIPPLQIFGWVRSIAPSLVRPLAFLVDPFVDPGSQSSKLGELLSKGLTPLYL
jgi:hypothetical protein